MPEPEAVLSHRRETTAGRSAVGTHRAAPGSAGGAGTLGVDVKVAEPRVPARGLVPVPPQEQTRHSDTPVGRHVTLRRDTPTSRATPARVLRRPRRTSGLPAGGVLRVRREAGLGLRRPEPSRRGLPASPLAGNVDNDTRRATVHAD